EFAVYSDRVRHFLRHPTRLLAAIFHGGLVARIASHMADVPMPGFNAVPSQTPQYGVNHVQWVGLGSHHFEYVLSEREIGLICGVYSLRSLDHANSCEVSWWPLPTQFQNSGLNTGVWTPVAEAWFLSQIGKVSSGPSTRTTWRSRLKFGNKELKTLKPHHAAFSNQLALAVAP
ncbi:hypothetical protein BXZ70DRAFT_893622, partial [Cristinia sonorae]